MVMTTKSYRSYTCFNTEIVVKQTSKFVNIRVDGWIIIKITINHSIFIFTSVCYQRCVSNYIMVLKVSCIKIYNFAELFWRKNTF
ncbi:TPA: hypothetical protein I4E15_15835 [Enterobacter asburiae]|nr:hypothetical protein [Enterobacter asburiae]HAS1956217.1 hypothetical protein [Enterobacter asburiae]HAS1965887.1 hypothetical protein [Enterobacter asburiae]